MDANAIKHEDMLEVSLIEGEAKIENGYYAQEPSNEDSTATINLGLNHQGGGLSGPVREFQGRRHL